MGPISLFKGNHARSRKGREERSLGGTSRPLLSASKFVTEPTRKLITETTVVLWSAESHSSRRRLKTPTDDAQETERAPRAYTRPLDRRIGLKSLSV